MGDPFGSYPLSSGKRGTLFQRNPVCSLCYRVCTHLSREHGGMNFPIIRCLEEADSLCEEILLNPWQINDIDYYFHWLDERLNGNSSAISCTVATVCVTLNCIEELPDHLRQLTDDLFGLISGVGFEIYETLSSAACRESISLSATTYGLPPPKPNSLIQLEQLQQENTRLTNHNKQLEKTIKSMKQEQDQRTIVKKFYGPYIENNNLSGGNQILTAENVYLPGAENVSISNAKNIQAPEPPSSSAATNKPECSEAPQSPVPRGRRIQYLFMDEYDHEDTKRTKQEAARVKQYVADHHWGQMRLDSKSTNRLNLMVACFWYYWHDRNWVPDIPQGAAIYRFVTEQCNLPCEVHPRAFMSAITRLINDHRKDPETYANLRTYFPQ